MPSEVTVHTIKFPIIGIGASAGGLDAFQKMIGAVPKDSGMAFIFVQHLPADHDSLLPALLQGQAKVPVVEINDGLEIVPDMIYVAPGNVLVSIVESHFKTKKNLQGDSRSIDIFFNSLAINCRGYARAVLLSGNGSDGTLGLKTIKEYGGTTIVQSPATAQNESMPLTAIRSAAADFVLDAEDIFNQLIRLDKAYADNFAYANDDRNLANADDDVYKQIIRLLRVKTGNDFSHYKQPTIRRRIARRMVIAKIENPETYLELLKNDGKEQEQLFNDILIPVSYFFRDSKVFDMLSETAYPIILENKIEGDTIRIWVAGCSTGEEAYSIAISIHEFLESKNANIRIQIFASDISESVISKARAGVYSRQEVQNISENRLKNYFTKIEGGYHINKEIRDMCIFAVHNFVKDPPFAKMDMITCRNVLIYLDPYLQKKSFATFHYALRSHGILFLGKSESANHAPGLFDPLIKNFKIFARKGNTDNSIPLAPERIEHVSRSKEKLGKKPNVLSGFQKQADELLFSKYTPAGVIVDEKKEIIHFHGNTGPFLLSPPGKPNFNIYKMVRDGLAFEVRSALLSTKTKREPIIKTGIPLKGLDYFADIEAIPLAEENGEMHILLLFKKSTVVVGEKKLSEDKKSAEQKRIKLLEAEIEQMREDIRKVTEDQEVSNEELQSANEELLSNSEELQTLNEELETSAEELQSNNEELITVNEELIDRQEQLVFSRLYAESIIENLREPLVILDSELRVKSANASYYLHFQTSEQDNEGRPIFETVLGNGNLSSHRDAISNALKNKLKLDDVEITVNTSNGERSMILNVRPISNEKLGETLLLLALEDITDLLAANKMLLSNNIELEENNRQLASFSFVASHDLQEPLRKIQLFCNMVLESETAVLSEEALDYLSRVVASAERMQQLIEDLLQYSQLNSVTEKGFEMADMTQLIGDSIADLDELIKNANAKLNVRNLPKLNVITPLVRQVFNNLIINALKYKSNNKRPEIDISCSIASHLEMLELGVQTDQKFCKIEITDNGIGFPADKAEKIFEPFYRLHSRDLYEGTGIGLSICRKIMTLHNGFIKAHSVTQAGSTFSLYFPQ